MTQEHSIIPSSKLVDEWTDRWYKSTTSEFHGNYIANQAAQWGANQELEACCEWISMHTTWNANRLHTARRPKQQSLKAQALTLIDKIQANKEMWQTDDLDVVRQALEQLND